MSAGDNFLVKDSGARQVFESGMKRDVQTGKVKWHLIASGPMMRRWAAHLTAGAEKYDDDNWLKADGDEEYNRFRASAFRHFMQWYNGDRDEDHGAAVYFNINGAEYVRSKHEARQSGPSGVRDGDQARDNILPFGPQPSAAAGVPDETLQPVLGGAAGQLVLGEFFGSLGGVEIPEAPNASRDGCNASPLTDATGVAGCKVS